MAIAGKVAITPGGEWSESTAYDKLVVVTYNNNLYLSKKANTGVAPTDEETWQLLIKNVTQEQYDNIINGTTQVGDSKKLGGKDASEYALGADLANYLPLNGSKAMTGDLILGNDGVGGRTTLSLRNAHRSVNLQIDSSGNFYAYDLTNSKELFLSNKNSANTWYGTATGNLPLTGGTITGSASTPLAIKNTNGNTIAMQFVGTAGTLGGLGFTGYDTPVFVDKTSAVVKALLHTGNSAKVVVSSTAPTDTTSAWLDTANKKVKAYIDGAWTAMVA